MSEPVLLVEKSEGIATLTLNRPSAMNALSTELRDAIANAFRDLQSGGDVRVALLTGAGRAFCAGLDLVELSSTGSDTTATFSGADMMEAIGDFEGPVIGAINGFAVTGGFELALACDLLVASNEARFADTHARVGILPGWGLSQRLPRLVGIHRAKELSLTGNYLSAERAEAWGLVSRVVPPDELLPTCRALAQDMLSCVPEVLRGYKQLIDEGFALPYGDALAHESQTSMEHMRTIKPNTLAERRAGIQQRGRAQSGD